MSQTRALLRVGSALPDSGIDYFSISLFTGSSVFAS